MRAWMLAVVCLVASGCRTDPDVVLLERENRLLEDRIYELEDLVEKYQAGLESCRRQQAAGGGTTEGVLARPAQEGPPRSIAGPALSLPEQKSTIPPEPGIPQPPVVEVPMPGRAPQRSPAIPSAPAKSKSSDVPAPPVTLPPPPAAGPGPTPKRHRNHNGPVRPQVPSTPQAPPNSARSKPAPSATVRPAGSSAAALAWVDNRRVQQVTLDRRLTGGFSADRQAGHEGIALLVEPRDAEGRLLLAAAPLSVVVLDKALSGPAARVARWDFSAQETAALWRRTPTGEGLYIEMPWPGAPPANSQLKLFVRFTTDDGRHLEADGDIEVPLAASQPSGWSRAVAGQRSAVAARTPAPSAELAPLWQPKPPTPQPLPTVAETPPPVVETAASPAAQPPPDTPPAPAETAPQRPVWSPYRR